MWYGLIESFGCICHNWNLTWLICNSNNDVLAEILNVLKDFTAIQVPRENSRGGGSLCFFARVYLLKENRHSSLNRLNIWIFPSSIENSRPGYWYYIDHHPQRKINWLCLCFTMNSLVWLKYWSMSQILCLLPEILTFTSMTLVIWRQWDFLICLTLLSGSTCIGAYPPSRLHSWFNYHKKRRSSNQACLSAR